MKPILALGLLLLLSSCAGEKMQERVPAATEIAGVAQFSDGKKCYALRTADVDSGTGVGGAMTCTN